MSGPSADSKEMLDRVVSKPNRLAIVKFIGERGQVSFKDLKAKLNLGVGTLYYHLDGVAELVSQNESRQYVLTEKGSRVYESVRNVDPNPTSGPTARKLLPNASNVVREILFVESAVERLAVDPMSNISIMVSIILVGSLISASVRIEPAVFFFRAGGLIPGVGILAFLASWLVIFVISATLPSLLWKSQRNLLGVAAASAFALIPITFALLLDIIRGLFKVRLMDLLYLYPYSIVFQVLLVIWAAYILTISLRSAINLNLEKALVVTLVVVLISVGYLWARPIVFPGPPAR